MGKKSDGSIITNQRLTFVRFSHFKHYTSPTTGKSQDVPYDVFKCICGKEHIAQRRLVKEGRIRSCGCLNAQLASIRMKKLNDAGRMKHNNRRSYKRQRYWASNKGKIRQYREDGSWYMVTPERADAIYYGLEGEVHSLRQRSQAHNKGKKLVDGHYQ